MKWGWNAEKWKDIRVLILRCTVAGCATLVQAATVGIEVAIGIASNPILVTAESAESHFGNPLSTFGIVTGQRLGC
jgi:hypothetical protein